MEKKERPGIRHIDATDVSFLQFGVTTNGCPRPKPRKSLVIYFHMAGLHGLGGIEIIRDFDHGIFAHPHPHDL